MKLLVERLLQQFLLMRRFICHQAINSQLTDTFSVSLHFSVCSTFSSPFAFLIRWHLCIYQFPCICCCSFFSACVCVFLCMIECRCVCMVDGAPSSAGCEGCVRWSRGDPWYSRYLAGCAQRVGFSGIVRVCSVLVSCGWQADWSHGEALTSWGQGLCLLHILIQLQLQPTSTATVQCFCLPTLLIELNKWSQNKIVSHWKQLRPQTVTERNISFFILVKLEFQVTVTVGLGNLKMWA